MYTMYLIQKKEHVNGKPGYENVDTITSLHDPDNGMFSSYYMTENNMKRLAENDLKAELKNKPNLRISEINNDECDIAIVDENDNIINEYAIMGLTRVDKNKIKEM